MESGKTASHGVAKDSLWFKLMSPRILIQIGQHLCTAPRPQKEADALAKAGFDVTVAGVWFDEVKIRRDQESLASKQWIFKPVLDFRPGSGMARFRERLKGRMARELFRGFGKATPPLFGYGATELSCYAREFRADLTIVHSEAGLWMADRLMREGLRVGVDFEDWFSEDISKDARAIRPVAELKKLERSLLQKGSYRVTTSRSLANALAADAGVPPPDVIYNVFPWAERKTFDGQLRDRSNRERISLHWFSQTIGPGRGLEMLFEALPMLRGDVELHLRGDGDHDWVKRLIPQEWIDRVFVHATVPNAELLSRVAEHDIGLALELPLNENKNRTISNKIFQYMLGGLAVVATNTAGQHEVFQGTPGVGVLLADNTPAHLAAGINDLLSNADRLSRARSEALNAAENFYCWERQSQRVVEAAEATLYSSLR